MENYNDPDKQPKGINKYMLIAVAAALVIVGGIVFLVSRIPSDSEQQVQVLEGAFREGSPEFEALTKRIVAETDEATQATTPLGMVLMTVNGKIRNNSDRVITALEVRVTIVDAKGNPVKDRVVLVVPGNGFEEFKPKQELKVSVSIDGFKETDDRADIRWKVTAIKAQ